MTNPPLTSGPYVYPPRAVERRITASREISKKLEAGVLDFVHKTGKYVTWVAKRLSERGVRPDIDIDLITMGPSRSGWQPVGRTALGSAWVLTETPKRWEPAHLTVNSDSVDYGDNDHWDPAHPVPAQGWCLLEDTRIAYYAREENHRRGEVYDQNWQPIIDLNAPDPELVFSEYDAPNGPITDEERQELLRFAGVTQYEKKEYDDMSTFDLVEKMRIAKDWKSVLNGYVDLRGLGQ